MTPRVWFKSISLENVRSFGTEQTINFTDKDGNAAQWNVILGDNGTGKTTVLKGLVVMAQNQQTIFETGADFTGLWRFGREDEGVSINGIISQGKEEIKTGFTNKKMLKNVKNSDASVFQFLRNYEIEMDVYTYGAARRISTSAISEKKLNPITSLFLENNDLTNAEEWLVQAEYISFKEPKFEIRYDTVLEILKKLFRGEVFDIYIDTETGIPKVFFKTYYGDVRLHELSLGYKTLIAWMVDFAKGLLDRYPESIDPLSEPAVCLVDEIDLHLHPKFQRNIIQFLTETFPNTQFIVTAHSPLIVQSAEDANIILLKREGDHTVVSDGFDVHSWRLDQILASDLFGGISTRPPETEERMSRRRALLLKKDLNKEEKAELATLEAELGQLSANESEEAIKAMDILYRSMKKTA